MVDGTGDVHVYQQGCSCGQFDIPVMAAVVRGGEPPMVVGDDELSPDQWSCLELANSMRDLQQDLRWQIAEARRRSRILR
jgi:hypothetical protein